MNFNCPFSVRLSLLEQEALDELGFSEITENSKNSEEIELLDKIINYNSNETMKNYFKKYGIPMN